MGSPLRLSAVQLDALRLMADSDGRLYRWRGGYWSPRPPTPGSVRPAPPPGPWCLSVTVSALERLGLVAGVSGAWAVSSWDGRPRELTDAGRSALNAADG